MTATPLPNPVFQAFGTGGLPLAFGQLFTYQAGTAVQQATWTDSTQTQQNTNPVILNALGQAFVWTDISKVYKFILQDAAGNQLYSQDNIPGSGFISSITSGSYGTDSGIVNAYVYTHTASSSPALLTAGTLIRFIPLNTNTGASTLNADGTGAVAVIRANGSALTGGELSSLGPIVLQSTGTQWQIVSTAGAQPGFERQAAETAAGVIPTDYTLPFRPKTDIGRYGFKVASSGATNATAIVNAMSVYAQSPSGGTLVFPESGVYTVADSTAAWSSLTAYVIGNVVTIGNTTYKCISNNTNQQPPNTTFWVPWGLVQFTESVQWEGAGMLSTKLLYTGVGTFIAIQSASARNQIRYMSITGTAKNGTGLQIGDSNFVGFVMADNCRFTGWATGVRLAASLTTMLTRCLIDFNTVGVDFNAGGSTVYSTVVSILFGDIRFNDHEGIAANNVPIRNQNVLVLGGSVEDNCQTDKTRYQWVMGSVEQVSAINVYFEDATAGLKANGIQMDGAGPGSIQECYFNGIATSLASPSSASQFRIDGCRTAANAATAWSGVTAYVVGNFVTSGGITYQCTANNTNNIPPNASFWAPTYDINMGAGTSLIEVGMQTIISAQGTNLLGANEVVYTRPLAQQINTATAFTPTLVGTGGGPVTYTFQNGLYSKVGNVVTFRLRISISALGALTGPLTVPGLPIASAVQAGSVDEFAAHIDGCTVSGGNTYFFAELPSGSTTLQLNQGGSTAAAQLTAAQLAAASSVYISGSYQAAS